MKLIFLGLLLAQLALGANIMLCDDDDPNEDFPCFDNCVAVDNVVYGQCVNSAAGFKSVHFFDVGKAISVYAFDNANCQPPRRGLNKLPNDKCYMTPQPNPFHSVRLDQGEPAYEQDLNAGLKQHEGHHGPCAQPTHYARIDGDSYFELPIDSDHGRIYKSLTCSKDKLLYIKAYGTQKPLNRESIGTYRDL